MKYKRISNSLPAIGNRLENPQIVGTWDPELWIMKICGILSSTPPKIIVNHWFSQHCSNWGWYWPLTVDWSNPWFFHIRDVVTFGGWQVDIMVHQSTCQWVTFVNAHTSQTLLSNTMVWNGASNISIVFHSMYTLILHFASYQICWYVSFSGCIWKLELRKFSWYDWSNSQLWSLSKSQ